MVKDKKNVQKRKTTKPRALKAQAPAPAMLPIPYYEDLSEEITHEEILRVNRFREKELVKHGWIIAA